MGGGAPVSEGRVGAMVDEEGKGEFNSGSESM